MTELNKKPAASIFNLLLVLLSVLILSETVNCQETTTITPATTTIASNSISTTTTTQKPSTSSEIPTRLETTTPQTTTATSTGEVLLSGNEFVDFTESPTILFDGLTNEKATGNNDTATDKNNSTSSLQVPATTVQPPTNAIIKNASISSSTSGEGDTNSIGELPSLSPNTTTTTPTATSDSVIDNEDSTDSTTDDYEPVDEVKEPAKLTFDPPKNVSQYMDYIERLFHDLRHQITDLFEPHIPQLIRTSQMVELSGSCSYDMLRMALALRQFEPWALRMIDSSGKVPEGIFEGSFTALGSYDECLSTVFSSQQTGGGQQQQQQQTGSSQHSSSQQQQQPPPTQGKYCLVNVSPFLPPKPPADRVELMFQEEADRRNYTKDDQFSRLSPMFYYMKFRIGVCIPSTCIESDMESISNALSSSLRLNITIPHCRVKQDQPITKHQLFGGLIFALVALTVLGATFMDYWRKKLEHLDMKDKNLFVLTNSLGNDNSSTTSNQKQLQFTAAGTQLPALLANCDFKQAAAALPCSSHSLRSGMNFEDRFRKHWSWMSFSLLTNYKLYFTHKQPPSLTKDSACQHRGFGQDLDGGANQNSTQMVRCLNGIRVLSLCWVIVANSYITLDPRATKRLTKTREAPKDFMFQLVAQASLAIETFFFLSGILVSMSFARKLKPHSQQQQQTGNEKSTAGEKSMPKKEENSSYLLQWIHFYIHRYIRMTPATMLVIAFTMFAFRYGDGPLWFEATHKSHMSCSENWWRHLLHVANFIDTRQMCFIHYWYIAADMQLFLFAPLLMFLIYHKRRIGYAVATLIGLASMGFVFYTTYIRNLPPTLLFYNSDPESRREFGNTIMTKPLTHALPYMVGMLVGKWLTTRQANRSIAYQQDNRSLATLLGLIATIVALTEVFLPYKWNNSHLPTRFMAALYAAVFRFGWSLVLAYLVIACAHPPGRRCKRHSSAQQQQQQQSTTSCNCRFIHSNDNSWKSPPTSVTGGFKQTCGATNTNEDGLCLCGSGGNIVNRLLSLSVFTNLSKLSFVAYLIHLPLMSVFISQTRGLFAFSHTLVIHLALSYLVMTFILSFVLVHIIEFPFLTFERYLFERFFYSTRQSKKQQTTMEQKEEFHCGKVNGSCSVMYNSQSNFKITQQQQQQVTKSQNQNSRSSNRGESNLTRRDYNGCDKDDKQQQQQEQRSFNGVVRLDNQVVGLSTSSAAAEAADAEVREAAEEAKRGEGTGKGGDINGVSKDRLKSTIYRNQHNILTSEKVSERL